MSKNERGDAPELLDPDLADPRAATSSLPRESSFGWAGLAVLVLMVAVFAFGRSAERAAPATVPTSGGPTSVSLPQPNWFIGSEVLVAPTASGVVAIATATGKRHEFVVDPPIRSVAAGSDFSVVLTDTSGRLLLLDLATQQVGFIGRDDQVALAASVEVTPEFLGDHELLGVANDVVLGEVCQERRCWLEKRSLMEDDQLDLAVGWHPTLARPASLAELTMSADGRWLTTHDDLLALYETDRSGIRLVHTSAQASAFSPDGSTLYIVTNTSLEAIDLIGDAFVSVPLAELSPITGRAIVVAA